MAWKEVIPYVYVAEHKNGEYKPVSYKGYYTSLPKAITTYNALYPDDAFYIKANRNDLTGIEEEYERIRAEEWAREDAERKREQEQRRHD